MKLFLSILAFIGVVNVNGGGTVGPPPPTDSLQANFTARTVGHPTQCIAPCPVHFDAIGLGRLSTIPYVTAETTDTVFDHEFHSLHFVWDFGDYKDSCGRIWENDGTLKNYAIGGIAGHTYCEAGTYQVTLKVTNPAGDIDTITHPVTIYDPEDVFTDANTYCFATSDSPNTQDWNGCPLDCAGGDDNCTIISNFDTAVIGGNNCNGTMDCASAGNSGPFSSVAGTKARLYFRRGDTFTGNGGVIIMGRDSAGGGPGLISTFGTGAQPIINNASTLDLLDRWTVTGLHPRASRDVLLIAGGPEPFESKTGVYNTAAYDMTLELTGSGEAAIHWLNAEAGDDGLPHLSACIECNLINYATTADQVFSWMSGRYLLYMGGTNDRNAVVGATTAAGYSMRGIGQQHSVMQHVRFIRMDNDAFQMRADDNHNDTYGPLGGNLHLPQGLTTTEDYVANQYMIVSDNLLDLPNDHTAHVFQVCNDSGCNCVNGGRVGIAGSYNGCGADGSGHIVDVHDYIFERNMFRIASGGSSSGASGLIRLTGGDHTVRDNIVSYRNTLNSGVDAAFAYTAGSTQSWSGTTRSTGVHVYNNTEYSAQSGFQGDFSTAIQETNNGETGCTSDCTTRNNLCVFGGTLGVGGTACVAGSGFTDSGSRTETSDPFMGAMPGSQTEQVKDFRPDPAQTDIVDFGTNFAISQTDDWDWVDARGFCRDSEWDVGAVEWNSVPCGYPNGVHFYFISQTNTDGTSGDDLRGTPTYDLPWFSITRALDSIPANSVVFMREGSYAEEITGNSMNPGDEWAEKITLQPFGNESVAVRPDAFTRVVFLASDRAQYFEIYGLDLDGTFVSNDVVKITCTGASCDTDSTNAAHHIRLINNIIHGGPAQGILITGEGSDFNEFIGNEIHHVGNAQNLEHGFYVTTDSNLILNNIIHDVAAAGIVVYNAHTTQDPDNNIVRGNESYSNGDSGSEGPGIQVCGADNLVELNYSHDNALGAGISVYDDNDPTGDGSICNAVNTLVKFNWIFNNNVSDGAIQVFSGTVGTVITPNIFRAP